MAGSNVPIDIPLTNISVAAFQSGQGFIADSVFPVVPVDLQTGLYYKFSDEDLNRDTAQRRADATESAGDTYEIASDNYRAEVWALHKDVGDQLQANYKNVPGTPFASAARFIAGKMRLRQETQFAADFLQAGVWANDLTGVTGTPTGNQFVRFDVDSVNPVDTVEEWKVRVSDNTGFTPNVLALGQSAYRALKRHPEIREQFKYTTAENITEQMLANILEIDKIVISKGMVNVAKRGAGVQNSRIFDKGALLAYAAETPGVEVPSAGYIFHWIGVSDGIGESIGTIQFRMAELRADRVESQIAFDNKVVAPSLGLLALQAVA